MHCFLVKGVIKGVLDIPAGCLFYYCTNDSHHNVTLTFLKANRIKTLLKPGVVRKLSASKIGKFFNSPMKHICSTSGAECHPRLRYALLRFTRPQIM
jgi:hypothetical protein